MAEVDLNYLDDERVKAFKRIQDLEASILELKEAVQKAQALAESKISVDEQTAQKAAVRAETFAESSKSKAEELTALISEIQPIIEEYQKNKSVLSVAVKKASEIEEKNAKLTEFYNSISLEQTKIQALQTQVDTLLKAAQDSGTKITQLETNSNSSVVKINDLLSKSNTLKTEISDLYDEIFGYDTENEKTGKKEHEDGLKDELDNTYATLTENMITLSSSFVKFEKDKTSELNKVISDATEKHDAIAAEIKSHLPEGVTAGLAGAYNAKKVSETKEMDNASKKFDTLLKWMVGIAIIPFAVYVFWLYKGKPMDEVIKAIPNMTLAVLPLYAPLIWLGIHLNKKINLSKKLIEEYAYKEAISRTVTGVSEQIKTLKDEDVSQEIHENLIKLIISAGSDNPGKYITNYNKCDNPVVEILSNPDKFSKFFEKTPAMLDGLQSILNFCKEKKENKQTEGENEAI